MKAVVKKMAAKRVYVYVAGGHLKVAGRLDDVQRQFIKRHRDELKMALSVDVEKYLKALAVGLPMDHTWLMNSFFTSNDLTLLSLGEYLGGDMEVYRDQIRQSVAIYPKEVTY